MIAYALKMRMSKFFGSLRRESTPVTHMERGVRFQQP